MCLKVISIEAAVPWLESNAEVSRRDREAFKKGATGLAPRTSDVGKTRPRSGCLTAEARGFSARPLPLRTSHSQRRRAGHPTLWDLSARPLSSTSRAGLDSLSRGTWPGLG